MSNLLQLFAQIKIPTDGIPRVAVNDATVEQILTLTFTAVGGIAILFMLVGAVRYAASNGEQAKVAQAKNTILYAVIGIIVSLSAILIVQFTIGGLRGNF